MSSDELFRAGDAKAWSICRRRIWYDYHQPEGFEAEEDPFERLIQQKGEEHERAILERYPGAIEAESAEHTRELLASGSEVIYQPTLIDRENGFVGRPDFLLRQSDGSYQVADAKLALSLRRHPELKIQLAAYRLAARSSHSALALLSGENEETVGSESDKQLNSFLEDMAQLLREVDVPTTNFAISKCRACPYDQLCRPEFVNSRNLGLVAGIDSRSIPALLEHGYTSFVDVASAKPSELPDVPYLKGDKKKVRVVAQSQALATGKPNQVAPIQLRPGTYVHFDVESDPLTAYGQQTVYLWGLLGPNYSEGAYQYSWADPDDESDRDAWLQFLSMVKDLKCQYKDLVLVHYSAFERTQITAYAKRFQMTTDPTVEWLLDANGPLFDLHKVVVNSLALPLFGYSLKDVCKSEHLVNFQWSLKESGSQWSVVRYHQYVHSKSDKERSQAKSDILTYNLDDVRASYALERWLHDKWSNS